MNCEMKHDVNGCKSGISCVMMRLYAWWYCWT